MKPYSVVLTLSLIAAIVEVRQSQLMKTLNCSSDYESYMECTWSESQEANAFVKMHLFHKEIYSNLTKMICNSQKLDTQIHWSCRRNESNFYSLRNDMFIFKPDRELGIQRNVDLFNNIQPLPPEKLNVTVTEERDFLLEWKAGGGTNRNHILEGLPLDFQVTYKRSWELWEISPVQILHPAAISVVNIILLRRMYCIARYGAYQKSHGAHWKSRKINNLQESSSVLVSNSSHYLLRHNNLVPGSRYVARVRSKPSQGSGVAGHYSDWSPVVTWQTQEDDAWPKNLQCYFNGIDRLKCSWEVRQEVSSSVLFTLFYKDNPGSEEVECSEVYQVPLISNNANYHVLQSCEINVTNPNRQSQYLVRVGLKEEAKTINFSQKIKPYPPYNLSMPVSDGLTYILQWNCKKIHEVYDLPKTYQISYWETGKPSEAKEVPSGIQKFVFTSQFLELGKSYTAKVRVKVNFRGYNGSWSEWSEEFGWPTTSAFPLWTIVPITVIFIILMTAGICFCQKYLLSMKKEWEANIPSPPKKFLLPNFFPKVQLANHSEDSSIQSSLAEEGIRDTSKLERELLTGGSSAIEDGSKKIHLVWSQNMKKIDPLNKANTGQICTSPKAQVFDFNGPYIYSSSESFVPTVQQDLKVTPSETKETPESLQYMGLPPLSLQRQPVGKNENTLSNVHQQMEEKLLFPTGQESSQIQEMSEQLEKGETEGWRPTCLSSSNSHSQNLPLDYIATVDLSISKEKGCLLPLPVLTSEEGMLPCANTATVAAQLPKTIENLSNSELCQKMSKPVLPVMDKGIGDLSAISQEESNDYVMNFSATSGSVSKDGLAFAVEEPKQEILIFSLGSRSPVFLYQEGEYCFFPGSKPTKEVSKGEEAPVAHQSPENFPKVTKSPWETKSLDSKLQVTSQVCQDL